MRQKVLWSTVGVMLLVVGGTAAEAKNFNHLLRGDYAFSGEATCLVSPGGFNQNFSPVGPDAPFPFVISFSVQGVRTFNGDGTGRVVGRTVGIGHPFALPATQTSPSFFNRSGTSSADFEADFTYEVAPDLTFTIEIPTGLSVTYLSGTVPALPPTGSVPALGQTATITNFPPFFGRISQDHRTLTLAQDELHIETSTYSTGVVQKRICHRSRILLELKIGK